MRWDERGKKKIFLRLVEVIVGFKSLEAVDEFFVGIVSCLEFVEIVMVVSNYLLDFLAIAFMNFRYPNKQIHYNLYVLYLFS